MLQVSRGQQQASMPVLRPVSIVAGVALLGAAVAGFNKAVLRDGDTSWHIAAGQWILARGTVPAHDPFSFSMPGQSWHAHEWLAEIPMALAYDLAGWSGIAILFMTVVGLTGFLIGRELTRHLPLRWVIAAMFALYCALVKGFLARPHVLGWAMLACWLLILLRARERHRAPPPAAALLMVAWATMHASYIVGLGLIGVFALEALVEDRDARTAIGRWGLFGLVSLAAAFVTPHGIQGFLYPFQVSNMEALSTIVEWQPISLRNDPLFVACVVALGGLVLLGWRKVGLVRTITLVAITAMTFQHGRHQALWGLFATLAVLPRIAAHFRAREGAPEPPAFDRPALAILVGGLAALAITRLAIPPVPNLAPSYMGGAFEAVPQELRSQPVLNEYSFGGPLILRGVKVFIDGRADMYGDRFTLDYNRMVDGDMPLFRRAVDRYDLRWTILAPGDRLVQKLDREPGWKRFYADRHAIVHVRVPQGR